MALFPVRVAPYAKRTAPELPACAFVRIIKITPVEHFGGAWCVEEAPGAASIFPGPKGEQFAINDALARLGDGSGEIHIYNQAGQIGEKMVVKGGVSFEG